MDLLVLFLGPLRAIIAVLLIKTSRLAAHVEPKVGVFSVKKQGFDVANLLKKRICLGFGV